MTDTTFSQDELLSTVKKYVKKHATPNPELFSDVPKLEEGTITRPFVMASEGIGKSAATRVIKDMQKDGLIVPDMVNMMTQWNRPARVMGYRFVDPIEPDQKAGLETGNQTVAST